MIISNPSNESKSNQCSASAASRLKLHHGAPGRHSSAARQPAASHNTNDLQYHVADRKPEIHPPIDLRGHMEAQSKQSSHEPAASNAIFPIQTFQNVFRRFFKPKPTFIRDAGLLSIATRRTTSKMSVFCRKNSSNRRQIGSQPTIPPPGGQKLVKSSSNWIPTNNSQA